MSSKDVLVALYLSLLGLMSAALLYCLSLSVTPHIFSAFSYHELNVTSGVIGSNKTLNRELSHFVSFHDGIKDGRRLGNQIFNLAAVIFVAELTNRTPVIANDIHISMEDVFRLNIERVSNLCPCHTIGEGGHLSYDVNTEKLNVNDPKIANQTILVSGFRQSWRYTLAIERRLRRHLVFKDEIQRFAESFLQQNIPRGWKKVGFVRVGIHIRRGDNLSPNSVNYGYTVPNEAYFFKAMKYFTDKYNRVQFIVASDDFNWTREHITSNKSSSNTINITYSFNHTAGQDLALLSMCEHVIMSTGTYGWWAAWLAKGTTIYYSDWPRKRSGLAGHFTRKDFFPPFWIPMTSS